MHAERATDAADGDRSPIASHVDTICSVGGCVQQTVSQ